jgi:hypothetical protein
MNIPPNKIEMERLLELARRELADAGVKGLSPDGSFEHSYNAALTVATVVVRANGERIHGPDHHRLTFDRFGQLNGARWANIADYLQHSRRRRNNAAYDFAGSVSVKEASELRQQTSGLLNDVEEWLAKSRPDLV